MSMQSIRRSAPFRFQSAISRLQRAAARTSIELLEHRRLLSAVVVNTATDQVDSSGSTVSLRDAITIANSATSPTVITFDPTVFATAQTIALTVGELSLTAAQNVTITGPTAGVTLNSNAAFAVLDDASTATNVAVSNVTFTDGKGDYGGAIEHTGSDTLTLTKVSVTNSSAFYDGAGIYNTGDLVIDQSKITGNTTLNTGVTMGVIGGEGGGIDNVGGMLTVKDSTVSGNDDASYESTGGGGIANLNGTVTIIGSTIFGNTNYAVAGSSYYDAPGGGIYSTGTLTLTNSTVSGNTGFYGGGIYTDNTATLSDDTISGNQAEKGGGLYGGTLTTVQNTVIAGNTIRSSGTGPDVFSSAAVSSSGHNFIGQTDGSSGWISSDITGTTASPADPMLAALTDNGGPTQTMLPVTGSPLIDAGSNTLIPMGITTDQRGLTRIVNNTVDIGSVEVQASQGMSSITYTPPTDQTAVAGISTTISLGSFTVTGTTAPYSIDVNWGDGTTDTTFSLSAAGTVTSQAHTFPTAGVDSVFVTVTDSTGVTASGSFNVLVTSGTIVVTPPANQTGNYDSSTSFSLGSFTATNTTAPYTVDVDWGDGTTDTTFTQNAAGTISSKNHTYTGAGSDTVTVTVTDASGQVTGDGTFVVTVAGPTITVTPPASQTALVGVGTSFNLGSFAVSNISGPYTVSVNWGDESAVTTFTASSAGNLAPQTHTYSTTGSDTVTVSVTNSTGVVTGDATFTVTVDTGTTANTTTLNSSTGSINFGQSVTLTAIVSPSAVTGSVTFYSNSVSLGTGTVASGIATLATTALVSGTDFITAIYSGDATYASSTSDGIDVVVIPPPITTTLALQSSVSTVPTNESFTLTASLSPFSVTGNTATGTVTFYQGSTVLGTAAIQSDGIAAYTTAIGLPPGSETFTAVYSGDVSFATSTSPAVTITVLPAFSSATLTTSVPSKTIEQSVTFTATVGSAAVTSNTLAGIFPAGTVTFADNGTVLGTVAITSDGVASLNTAAVLPTGIDILTATYSGSSIFAGAASNPTDLYVTTDALVPVVNKAAVSPKPAIGGTPVRGSITATLTNELNNIETGFENGIFSVRLYASPSSTFDPSADPVVSTYLKKAKIAEGKSLRVTVPITTLPATLATGNYHLLLETTDAAGNTEVVDTGSTFNVIAPAITLSTSFAPVSLSVLKKGALLSLSAAGNASDQSAFTATVGFSTDPVGTNIVASGTGVVTPAKVLVHLGKTSKVRVTGWQSLFASLPIGHYYLTVTLTDDTGHTASAISNQTIYQEGP